MNDSAAFAGSSVSASVRVPAVVDGHQSSHGMGDSYTPTAPTRSGRRAAARERDHAAEAVAHDGGRTRPEESELSTPIRSSMCDVEGLGDAGMPIELA